MKTYRGSEAPLAMACPASVNAPEDEIRIESSNPAATVGTAVHRICEIMVNNGKLPDDWQTITQMYGLDEAQTAEVGSLIYAGQKFWDEYGQAFEHPETEIEIETEGHGIEIGRFKLSGHIDVLVVEDESNDH